MLEDLDERTARSALTRLKVAFGRISIEESSGSKGISAFTKNITNRKFVGVGGPHRKCLYATLHTLIEPYNRARV